MTWNDRKTVHTGWVRIAGILHEAGLSALPAEKFHQVGNAAGVGAKQMLISPDKRQEAEQLAGQINYVELTTRPAFTSLFMEYLSFKV